MQNEIKEKIKDAMRAKDEIKLAVFRSISAAFTNDLVSKNRTPQDILTDEECMDVVRRLAKQRKDSIEQFEKGGRPELAEAERKELSVLETLLPQMMDKMEIKKFAEAKKTEMGITDKTKSGILMGALMKDLKGKADGSDVKEVVESLF